MASKSYRVSFDILGSLDPSLLNSIKAAQDNLKALGKLNGKAIGQAQRLNAAHKKLGDLEHYKRLQREIKEATKARALELLTASRANAALANQQKNIAAMKSAYRDLQKTQARLKGNAQLQRNGIDLARAGLRDAKKTGDVAAIQAAQQALIRQQESARRAAQEVKAINAALKQGKAELKSAQADIKTFGSILRQGAGIK